MKNHKVPSIEELLQAFGFIPITPLALEANQF